MHRRNEFDVENRINTTDSDAVLHEVRNIFQDLYQKADADSIDNAFDDLLRLYCGDFPGYHACDTAYHDIQHVLDVTLAMARLMDGAVRAVHSHSQVLNERLFSFGIVSALYHDCGYIRHRADPNASNGAEYTKTHVSRGGRFLEEYLHTIGLEDFAPAASRTLHFTGYEMPIREIRVDPEFRLIGNLLGSADILAQMADRCYLEKCYDRLFPEFVAAGIARTPSPDGSGQILFGSAAELIFQTPTFYHSTQKRLNVDLGGYCAYIEKHFGGENPYVAEVDKNIEHARKIAEREDLSMLRRKPPDSVTAAGEEAS